MKKKNGNITSMTKLTQVSLKTSNFRKPKTDFTWKPSV